MPCRVGWGAQKGTVNQFRNRPGGAVLGHGSNSVWPGCDLGEIRKSRSRFLKGAREGGICGMGQKEKGETLNDCEEKTRLEVKDRERTTPRTNKVSWW